MNNNVVSERLSFPNAFLGKIGCLCERAISAALICMTSFFETSRHSQAEGIAPGAHLLHVTLRNVFSALFTGECVMNAAHKRLYSRDASFSYEPCPAERSSAC